MQNTTIVTGVVRDILPGYTTKGIRACSAKILVAGKFVLTVRAYGAAAEVLAGARAGQTVTVAGPLVPAEINPATGKPKTSKLFVRADAVSIVPDASPSTEVAAAHLGNNEVPRD